MENKRKKHWRLPVGKKKIWEWFLFSPYCHDFLLFLPQFFSITLKSLCHSLSAFFFRLSLFVYLWLTLFLCVYLSQLLSLNPTLLVLCVSLFSLSWCFFSVTVTHCISFSLISLCMSVCIFLYVCVSLSMSLFPCVLCVSVSLCQYLYLCVSLSMVVSALSHTTHIRSLTHTYTTGSSPSHRINKPKYSGTLHLFRRKCNKMETAKQEWEYLSLPFCLFKSQDQDGLNVNFCWGFFLGPFFLNKLAGLPLNIG